ncbi:hypothetical protein FIV00_17625 [Labrenzia sp. THAF82]|uniref:hypothetical protein n=1 Tax=Labrenzia sp. THAF82 TaxID=2587861 RepID=UPI001268F7B5|nr:hypothetical protein [Labrenzia sp. THAF82]QFT32315.1 hypothetical protein FIV00_17625 [Labrenzia sp. THAF82]
MKPPSNPAAALKKPARAVTTSTMKRVEPPRPRKTPQVVSQSGNSDQVVEAIRQRVNDLEARLGELESIITLQNQDVIISAPKSVLIQGLDTVEISAGSKLKFAASISESSTAIAKFSGIVECDVLKANTVMGAAYTPGAGNIW